MAQLIGGLLTLGLALLAGWGYVANIIKVFGGGMEFIETLVRLLGIFPFFFIGIIAGFIN
jgi:hypothetical protein